MIFSKLPAAMALVAFACWPPAFAQVTIKPDGQWRHLFAAGASVASGNSDATSVNLSSDSVRATDIDKWSITGRALYASSEGETTGERIALGTQYNRDITPRWFLFGLADALRDEPANLSSRLSVAAGPGYHVWRRDADFWDVSAGLSYTQDRFIDATEIDGRVRSRYGRAELLLAEESSHQLTSTTAFTQKLRVLPNLRDTGAYRADFESSLTVAINSTLSLTAGLAYRYDSDPGEGFERGDTLFVTGLSYRLD
jgi:putative salt-induced outer membrane protein YdiY